MSKWYIWTVAWCIVTLVQDPCPDKPYKDKFGVTHYPAPTLVLYAHEEYDCDHTQWFSDRDSAIAFYNEAVNQDKIKRVKFDSVIVYGKKSK